MMMSSTENPQQAGEVKSESCEGRKQLIELMIESEKRRSVDIPPYTVEIKLLAYNRPHAIMRCLRALERAEYGNDRVDIVVFLDHFPVTTPQSDIDAKLSLHHKILEMVQSFKWSHGSMRVHWRATNANLQIAWIESFYPVDNDTYAFVVEDDIEVSPMYYMYLKKMIDQYRYTGTRNPFIYGISFQRQHLVPGYYSGKSVHVENQSQPYLYQLVGTWGQILFPEHWREFRRYFDERRAFDSLKPRLGGLITDYWYQQKGEKIWTPWFIRFVYAKGYYCLYTNFPGNKALSASHRDVGENFGVFHKLLGMSGTDAPLLTMSSDMELWKKEYTKNLLVSSQLTKFDYCFQEVKRGEILKEDTLFSLRGAEQDFVILLFESDLKLMNQLCFIEQHVSRTTERELKRRVLIPTDKEDLALSLSDRGYKAVLYSKLQIAQVIQRLLDNISSASCVYLVLTDRVLLKEVPQTSCSQIQLNDNVIAGRAEQLRHASQGSSWDNIPAMAQYLRMSSKVKLLDKQRAFSTQDQLVVRKDDLACKEIKCWR